MWKRYENQGTLKRGIHVLHIRVLHVAPLGSGDMTESGINQYEGGFVIWEATYYSGAAKDLMVRSFDDIFCANAGPAFTRKVTARQRQLYLQ